jgi:hypothetical protein
MERKIVYYSDELHDEFSGVVRDTMTIDETYVYAHTNPLWQICRFIVYRIIMTPVAYVYLKIKFHAEFVNREVLKQSEGKSIFLFGNHTQIPGDGYIPTTLVFPKNCSVIVNADNVSLPGTLTFMKMVGAVPLPNKISGMRNYMNYLTTLSKNNSCIAVFPEAHIWPYYTGIRPFPDDSFRYPAMYGLDTYCFTTTYQQRGRGSSANMKIFVDGPFSVNPELPRKEGIRDLRDRVYTAMCARSRNSTYEHIIYRKQEHGGNI